MNPIRLKIQELADLQKPDASWVELAALLGQVKKDRLFREWGFDKFSAYCSAELHFGKSVASDMIRGRAFIAEHFPKLLSNTKKIPSDGKIPGYNEIALLRRAENSIPEKDFARLKEDVFIRDISRDKLRAKINNLLPEKRRYSDSINDLKARIQKLEQRIQDLEEELEFYKGYNGFDGFNQDYLRGLRRRIMRHVHPDRGGDTEVAQDVNNFFDQIIN